MLKQIMYKWLGVVCLSLAFAACKTPALVVKSENRVVPVRFRNVQDSTNTAKTKWSNYFKLRSV